MWTPPISRSKLKEPVAEPCEENLKSVVLSECGGALRRLRKLSDLFVSAPPDSEECIHVIVDAPYPEVTCWVRGGKTHESVSISIKANVSVNQLHPRIKEAHEALKQVATEHTHLYRVPGSVQELRETLDQMDKGTQIYGTCVLYDAFLDLPVLEPHYVVVQISAPTNRPPPKLDQVRVAREAFLAAHPPCTWLMVNVATAQHLESRLVRKQEKKTKDIVLVD
ncbi:hypothetical protein J3R82DRAFT_4740 [Butyriboletus roseoflavus]|nr:hypothetical protein J3R82DRAFT_4740 [Butyriboletus roseoflavus]